MKRQGSSTAPILDGIIFSNAASCLRREVWNTYRFVLPAAEDIDWAERVIDAGWRIVYEPAASVLHSHNDTARQRAKRLIDLSLSADITSGRGRSRMRTTREAIGLILREFRTIRTPRRAGDAEAGIRLGDDPCRDSVRPRLPLGAVLTQTEATGSGATPRLLNMERRSSTIPRSHQ